MSRYNHSEIEAKWSQYWSQNKTFATPRLPRDLPSNRDGKKAYVLDMFPYPSGQGLHVGHPEGYTATDVYCRYLRMNGYSVMHPMGWDAFGLPAEQHAKKTGIHPRITTEKNIANFRRQLHMLGFSYDWDREIATTDSRYFRWTQFIFLLLFNSWYDKVAKRARNIEELPIPEDVAAEGEDAVRHYIDDHRLAYQTEAPVNWCPELGTVLANEEVVGGVSERGGFPVERRPLRQWMLRIKEYADRLEEGLDDLNWPESVKTLQRNWIGKSVGAEVDFYIGNPDNYSSWKVQRESKGFPRKPQDNTLRVFTTRPDTLYGVTYMVIAPEHPALKSITTPEQQQQVENYCRQASFKSELDRTALIKDKTGVFTGAYAINPLNNSLVPIWVADYVIMSYGTGAIMAVPAHDSRDYEFARKFNLPIKQVVKSLNLTPQKEEEHLKTDALSESGVAVNSGEYDGTPTEEFKTLVTQDLENKGLGKKTVNYKLRDWLFSRQHFWGEPFPLLRELDEQGKPTGVVVPLDPSELPLDLPEGMTFDASKHSPEPPLEQAPREWLYVERNGKKYKRETNTMPQWAGSCWYYLRFLDPSNDKQLVDPEIEKAWAPVDLYIGGAEHAVLHLLYARFWHKVLYDLGYVSTSEPFTKLVNQGMILGEMEFTAYQNEEGNYVSLKDVEQVKQGEYVHKTYKTPVTPVKIDPRQIKKDGDSYVLASDSSIVISGKSEKMSKSRGNVVNPDDIVSQYGADSLRLYEMFLGPLEAVKPWNQDGVSGVRSFLERVWRMITDEPAEEKILNSSVKDVPPTPEQDKVLHKTIKAVTEDIQNLSYNTAIARMMEFVKFFGHEEVRPLSAMKVFILLLSPFAPHIAEELWELLGNTKSLAYENWPLWNNEAIQELKVVIPVQVNGKLRARLELPVNLNAEDTENYVLQDRKVDALLKGQTIVKKIVIPGKLVNFVVRK